MMISHQMTIKDVNPTSSKWKHALVPGMTSVLQMKQALVKNYCAQCDIKHQNKLYTSPVINEAPLSDGSAVCAKKHNKSLLKHIKCFPTPVEPTTGLG